MTDIQHVTFNLLPRAEGLLSGTITFINDIENYNKDGLLKNLTEIHQLIQQSKDSLFNEAIKPKR